MLYLVPDPVSANGIGQLNPAHARSTTATRRAAPHAAYERMAEAILEPVARPASVCAAFYGHPGVFVLPVPRGDRAARAARASRRRCCPASPPRTASSPTSASTRPRRAARATRRRDFLERRPAIEPPAALVLWQIGVVGARTHSAERPLRRLPELVELLRALYPADHEVVVYEASSYPRRRADDPPTPLDELGADAVTLASTLYVPPVPASATRPAATTFPFASKSCRALAAAHVRLLPRGRRRVSASASASSASAAKNGESVVPPARRRRARSLPPSRRGRAGRAPSRARPATRSARGRRRARPPARSSRWT